MEDFYTPNGKISRLKLTQWPCWGCAAAPYRVGCELPPPIILTCVLHINDVIRHQRSIFCSESQCCAEHRYRRMVSLENLVARTLMMMVAHADIYLYSSVSSRFRCSYLRLFLTPNLINDDKKKKKKGPWDRIQSSLRHCWEHHFYLPPGECSMSRWPLLKAN